MMLPYIFIILIFILDRFTKLWITHQMFLGESWSLLPFFHLTYVRNTGIAFGLGKNWNTFFIMTTILLIIILFVLYRRWQAREGRCFQIAFSLIIGGALGNLYDRIVFGSVVDFLDFFIGEYHWPAFNMADSAICIGAFLLLLTQKWRPHDHET